MRRSVAHLTAKPHSCWSAAPVPTPFPTPPRLLKNDLSGSIHHPFESTNSIAMPSAGDWPENSSSLRNHRATSVLRMPTGQRPNRPHQAHWRALSALTARTKAAGPDGPLRAPERDEFLLSPVHEHRRGTRKWLNMLQPITRRVYVLKKAILATS